MSWILRTAVLPSLNEKSTNSSPLEAPLLTIPPSTLTFLPAASAPESFEISGSDSYFKVFEMDYYKNNINKLKLKIENETYLECLVAEVLNGGLELVISVQVDGISGGVKSLLKVWLE